MLQRLQIDVHERYDLKIMDINLRSLDQIQTQQIEYGAIPMPRQSARASVSGKFCHPLRYASNILLTITVIPNNNCADPHDSRNKL